MAVEKENSNLAEAYLQECSRLICDSTVLSPFTKASRLTDLARGALQVNRKDWGKRFLEYATRMRTQPGPGSANVGNEAAVEATV